MNARLLVPPGVQFIERKVAKVLEEYIAARRLHSIDLRQFHTQRTEEMVVQKVGESASTNGSGIFIRIKLIPDGVVIR